MNDSIIKHIHFYYKDKTITQDIQYLDLDYRKSCILFKMLKYEKMFHCSKYNLALKSPETKTYEHLTKNYLT